MIAWITSDGSVRLIRIIGPMGPFWLVQDEESVFVIPMRAVLLGLTDHTAIRPAPSAFRSPHITLAA